MPTRKRRTAAESQKDFERLDREQAVIFRERLGTISDYDKARRLVDAGPPPDAPGRRYYSNLAFYLGAFVVPHGSSDWERGMYMALVRRLDAAGQLKPGTVEEAEAALGKALPPPLR